MKPKQFHDFKTVKDKVNHLLLTNPALRDNDMKLIATYYFHEIGKEEIDSLNAYDLLTKISSSKMTNFESIRRFEITNHIYLLALLKSLIVSLLLVVILIMN
jgi:hypothetical protein